MKYLVVIFVLVLSSCAPSRYIIPLNRKEKAFGVSVGGPMIEENTVVTPVPLVNVSYAYGKTNKLTYFGGLQLSPVFDGYYAGDLGVLKEWYWNGDKNLGFSTNLAGNVMTNKYSGRLDFYPQLDANLYWHFKGDPHYYCDCPGDPKFMMFLFTGFSSYFKVINDYEFDYPFDEDVIFSPHIGYSFGSKNWKLNTEVKWIQPWYDNTQHDPKIWNPVMYTGAFGGYLTFYYHFD